MDPNLYLTYYTKMDSRWIKCLNGKNGNKGIEKTDSILNHLGMRKTLLSKTQEKLLSSNKYKLNENLHRSTIKL